MKMQLRESLRADCADLLSATRVAALEPLRNSAMLVTGGTGFVGSWIAELVAHLNDAHNFGTRLLLLARGTDAYRKLRPHIAERRDVELLKGDVRNTFEIPRDIQWIVHAAATPDTRTHTMHPVDTMTTIAQGTETILRAAERLSGLRMLLNVSSGLVYGPQALDIERISEDCMVGPPLNTQGSAYAEAKRYAETLCASFRNQARLPVAVVRPFAFMGPYQSLTGPWAASTFLADAIANRKIRVLGDGETVRSYMYGSDLGYWMLRVLAGAEPGAVYNIGNPEPVTLRNLALLVAAQCENAQEIQFSVGTGAALQRSRLVPNVTRAVHAFDLATTVSLEAAVRKTMVWHRLAQEVQ